MPHTWRVEGSGFSYTFPDNFDLRSYDRSQAIDGRPVHRGDGVRSPGGYNRRGVTTHLLTGIIQKDSVANTLAELDKLMAAVSAPGAEVYLVNVDADRRIKVKLERSEIPRDPARMALVNLFFQTTDIPYWEDRILTVTKGSSQHYFDLPIGNTYSKPVMTIEGPLARPTLVKSNWSLSVQMDHMEGEGISNRAGKQIWDKFAGVSSNVLTSVDLSFVTGKFGNGIKTSSRFTFTSMVDGGAPLSVVADRINRNQGSIYIWVKVSFASTDATTRVLFCDGGSSNELKVQWNGGSTRFEISDGTNTAFRNPGAFAVNDVFHIVASWDSRPGANLDGASSKLAIWVNGTAGTGITSYLTGTPGTTLYLTTDSALTKKFDAAYIDDFGILDIPLSTAEIASLYNSGTGNPLPDVITQIPLVYFPMNNSGAVSETALGSNRDLTLPVTAIAASAVTTRGSGTQFVDNQPILIWDKVSGFFVYGFINGVPTATSVPVDDGAGGNIARLTELGIYATLDGTNYFDGGNVLDVTTGHIAIGAWIKTSSGAQQTIVCKGNGVGSAGYVLYIDTAGKVNFSISNGTTTQTLTGGTSVNDGNWHHVYVANPRGSTIGQELCVDGYRDWTPSGTHTVTLTNAQNFRIGAESDGGNPFIGSIRDVHFWGLAANTFISSGPPARRAALVLTVTSLQAHIYATTRVEDGWWKLTDATAGALGTDSAASPNNLTPTNSPVRTVGEIVISNNLVVDPDCDLPQAAGWSQFNSWDPNPTANVLRTATQSIYKNTKARFIQSGTAGVGLSRRFFVERNTFVRLGFRATTKSEGSGFQVAIVDLANSSSFSPRLIPNDSVWNQYEMIVPVHNTAGSLTHELECRFSGNARTYADVFWCYPSVMTEGQGKEKTNWAKVKSPATLQLDTGVYYQDSSGLRLATTGTLDGLAHPITTLGTIWYEASGFIRTVAGTAQLRFSVASLTNTDGATTLTFLSTATGPELGSFTRKQLYFRTGTDLTGHWKMVALSSQNFTVDEMAVTKRVPISPDLSQIVSIQTEFPVVRPSERGVGRNFAGGGVSFPSLIQRGSPFGFIVRLRANNSWANQSTRVLFDFNKGTSLATKTHYQLSLATNRWVFGNNAGTVGGAVTAYALNKDLQIAGYVDVSSSTIKARLFENDYQIGAIATFATLSVSTLNRVNFGLNRSGVNPAYVIMQEAHFFQQGLLDSFYMGEGGVRRKLSPEHQLVSYASTLATLDYLVLDSETERIDHWSIPSSQSPTLINGANRHNAVFLELGGNYAHSLSNKETVFSKRPMTATFNYRKQRY